jgi:hypothetical protein
MFAMVSIRIRVEEDEVSDAVLAGLVPKSLSQLISFAGLSVAVCRA